MLTNLSIFAMIVIDTWLVYSAIKNTPTIELNQKEFYSVLAEELIDNTYGNRGPQGSPISWVQDACIRAIESCGPRACILTH